MEFKLASAEFERFVAALDRPAKAIPALEKLMTEESVLEALQRASKSCATPADPER